MDTITLMLGFLRDLLAVWSPLVLPLVVLLGVGLLGTKMVRTARSNALIRAERKARADYRAPVIDITERLANRSNIA